MTRRATEELAGLIGVKPACQATGYPRASYYKEQKPPAQGPRRRPGGDAQPNALTEPERQRVLDTLHSPRFADLSVREAYHSLLDEGCYLASPSTMYRLLRATGETAERRRQATRPARVKPELHATGPNQVWSWDITKLRGPGKWEWFHLYTVIDVYSRANPAWTVQTRESDTIAEHMIADAIAAHGIRPGQLTVHADNGSSMTSKTVAQLLSDLAVAQSHSRPHVSNDNPFSESQFKTLKYRPEFPDRFDSIQHARQFCQEFFHWYNHEHHHSGIGYHTPWQVHTGQAPAIAEARQTTLDQAHTAHPERFRRGRPTPPALKPDVWINPPPANPNPNP